jgi:hypothetical protein
VLPRQRIVPLLVDVLDEVGDVSLDFDGILKELVEGTQTPSTLGSGMEGVAQGAP